MLKIDKNEVDTEILPLMFNKSRPDVRALAMEYFLGLTGTSEGKNFIASNDTYMDSIIQITKDEQAVITRDAYLALTNLSGDEVLASKLFLKSQPNFVSDLLKYVLDKDSPHADEASTILANMSRSEVCSKKILRIIQAEQEEIGFDKIIKVFCLEGYNAKNKLNHLGSFLCNLTQVVEARQYILDRQRCVIQRLLPYTMYQDSMVRRRGISGTLRNCCFETESHDWLLSEEVDILPRLLLPLAGPEEFDADDNDKLPPDLQYLEPEKTREPDLEIRKQLVEAIHQLCATKSGRLYVKSKNTYVIMRELHRWEKDREASMVVMKLIDLLIGDEPGKGMDSNLKNVDVPEKYVEQFNKNDEEMLKDDSSDEES